MRIHWKQSLGVLAVAAMALPVWARTDSVKYVISQPVTIQGVTLAPGHYDLKADTMTNQVTVEKDDGTTVAQVPCKWVQLPQKARNSEVLSQNSKVTELEFSGQTDAATFTR